MIQTLHFKKIQALITGAVAAAVLILTALPGYSQQQQTREEYIEKYKDAAIQYMETHGIPASITLAQGCLESANGNSDLAVRANNHFGIKCKRGWTGRKVYHDDDAKGECFRAYPSVEASYHDHAEFSTRSPATTRSSPTTRPTTAAGPAA